jgi:U3 small nucleolar RNA-associated protein 21
VHDTKLRKLTGELALMQAAKITTMVHPATYVNKFVVGFSNGQLELWNLNSKKMLYTFKSHMRFLSKGGERADGADSEDELQQAHAAGKKDRQSSAHAVTCMEQSPACDVIGVGFSNGVILLLNLKLDQVLFSFTQKGGAVTSLSFRTDGGAEKNPHMSSSSADGRIHIWNLGSNAANGGDDTSVAGQLKV